MAAGWNEAPPGVDRRAASAANAARTCASVFRLKPKRRASSKPLKRNVVCKSPLGIWEAPQDQSGPGPAPSCTVSPKVHAWTELQAYDCASHLGYLAPL